MSGLNLGARSGTSAAALLVLSLAVAGAVLAFDLSLPLGVAGGVPYVALVLVGLWAPWRRYVLVLAAVATVLTLVGYAFSPPGGVPWIVLTNRLLVLFAIWVVAALAFERKGAEGAKARRSSASIGNTPWAKRRTSSSPTSFPRS